MRPPRPPAPCSRSTRPRGLATATLLALALLVLPLPARAQATPRAMDGWRVGVTLGGTALVGLSIEWIGEDQRGLEGTVSTWGFRDVALGLSARQYFGGSYLRPVLGAGLWAVRSFSEDTPGTALLVRAPLGFDWRATGEQFLGVTVAANRVLWLVRGGPEAEEPPVAEGRLVPLPEIAWRWRP